MKEYLKLLAFMQLILPNPSSDSIILSLKRIPAKDDQPNGNGCKNGNDDDPGQGFADIAFAVCTDIVYGADDKRNENQWAEYHPKQAQQAFQLVHNKLF